MSFLYAIILNHIFPQVYYITTGISRPRAASSCTFSLISRPFIYIYIATIYIVVLAAIARLSCTTKFRRNLITAVHSTDNA